MSLELKAFFHIAFICLQTGKVYNLAFSIQELQKAKISSTSKETNCSIFYFFTKIT